MIRDDFILRTIRRIAQAILKAMGLRQEDRQDEAHAVLDAAARSLVGLELDLAEAMTPRGVVELLSGANGPDAARLAGLAQLLGARGELLIAEDQLDRAAACLERAVALGLRAARVDSLLPPEQEAVGAEVERLARLLDGPSLPGPMLQELMALAEACGRLSDAEDWLGLAEDRGLEGLDGAGFWTRLSRLEDATLEAGGLSRAEVDEEIARRSPGD
ncbi:MAG: hypothetical protein H6741_17510 [Alphaproteobacteria bacterium]|nr:hypothetical protein [Alphaproteobacteria bacterium]MCB9794516.1 hypothetical protein [Alphaproteobacteria bacterium]